VAEGEGRRWLRDWGFWGVVIGGVAILVSIGIAFWQQSVGRSVKELSWGIVSQGRLVDVHDNMKGRLKVLFDGVPRTDLKFVVLKIANTGNVPIEEHDFAEKLTLNFGDPILDAGVAGVVPPDLKTQMLFGGRQLVLDPLLLNPGDSVSLKVFLGVPERGGARGSSRVVEASTHIAGVSRLRKSDTARPPRSGDSPWLRIGLFVAGGYTAFILRLLAVQALSKQGFRMG
jgi:hypothetical protein